MGIGAILALPMVFNFDVRAIWQIFYNLRQQLSFVGAYIE